MNSDRERQPVYFVVVVDADPKRSSREMGDHALLKRYQIALDLLKEVVAGKAVICLHTSPRYPDRFFRSPFVEFWGKWISQGGEIALHPENYTVDTGQGVVSEKNYYHDHEYMRTLIHEKIALMDKKGIPCAAFRGGFFGFTDGIASALREVGIRVDLSCAPGFVFPSRTVDWSDSPASGYLMSLESYRKPAVTPAEDLIFEIPIGWDGKGRDLSRNYLFNERSSYIRLCQVWDSILQRALDARSPQFVNFLCHTYLMGDRKIRGRCEKILIYMLTHQGLAVTATEARKLYTTQ